MRIATTLLALSSLLASACGSPTSPGTQPPSTDGPPAQLNIPIWTFGAATTLAPLEATWGTSTHVSRDVTNDASWESSDTTVFAIARAGQLISTSPGDAELRVTFRGVTLRRHIRVFAGESPLWVIEPDTATCVGNTVRNALTATGPGIDGVTIEITEGHNAGRAEVTGQSGSYCFAPPFVCGLVTVRASKPGYRERTVSSVMCQTGMPGVNLTPVP